MLEEATNLIGRDRRQRGSHRLYQRLVAAGPRFSQQPSVLKKRFLDGVEVGRSFAGRQVQQQIYDPLDNARRAGERVA